MLFCSAGIGRTGTLILSLLCLQQISEKNYVDPLECLNILRQCRPRLVENWVQYRFAHEILIEVLNCKERSLDAKVFIECYNQLYQQVFVQFQEIEQLKEVMNDKLTFDLATRQDVIAMNRNPSILPADVNIILATSPDNSLEYVNAVVMRSIVGGKLIVAEHPTKLTEIAMWRLVFEQEVSLWVLGNLFAENDKNYPPILADPHFFRRREFHIAILDQSEDEGCVKTKIQIENRVLGGVHTCQVVQMVTWRAHEALPADKSEILEVLDLMTSNVTSGPLLVSCSDGVTVCGVIATSFIALQDFASDGLIDIFRGALKSISERQSFIVSEEQYMYIYEVFYYYLQFYYSRNSCDYYANDD